MTMEPIAPGKETTEFKALKWVSIVCAVIVSLFGALTAAGIMPQEGLWATVLGAAWTVAKLGAAYSESRGVVKSTKLMADSAANPPLPPKP
jgi:hypothetical protein